MRMPATTVNQAMNLTGLLLVVDMSAVPFRNEYLTPGGTGAVNPSRVT